MFLKGLIVILNEQFSFHV